MEETSFDPTRRLCPDGACVGILGPDGLCSVCRRTESAAARGDEAPEAAQMVDDDLAGGAPSGSAPDSMSAARPASSESGPGFDAKRRLCDDGSCVGLVGADGRCGVCGRKAE
jgi:hypothetical protein